MTDVLDHGYVRLLDTMGGEEAIVRAAWVSYGNDAREYTEAAGRRLIRYLMRNRHTSPFEMAVIRLEVNAPIFVLRQWQRHRTASINEVSRRYVDGEQEPVEVYDPAECGRIVGKASDNKQGSGAALVGDDLTEAREKMLGAVGESTYAYTDLTTWYDLAPEVARTILPLGSYSRMVWQIDLHNLLHFLELRLHPHAQYEIRVYAEAIADMVKAWVPNVWEAFVDYRLESHTFSRQEMAALRETVKAAGVTTPKGITRREWRAFAAALGINEEA